MKLGHCHPLSPLLAPLVKKTLIWPLKDRTNTSSSSCVTAVLVPGSGHEEEQEGWLCARHGKQSDKPSGGRAGLPGLKAPAAPSTPAGTAEIPLGGTLWDKETFEVRAAALQVTHCNQPPRSRPLCGSYLRCMHKYLHVAILSHGGTKRANVGEQVTPG